MEKKKILVVDDEADICNILKFNLDNAGFDTTVAHSGEEALAIGIANFDLILLDIMMDKISGLQLAQQVRKKPETANIPIIFVTAKDTENDMVKGFNIGADDYIPKPFSIREVITRVQAVLRRSSRDVATQKQFEHLVLDMVKKVVTIDGEEIDLTKTELEILNLLISHPGTVFSREDILAKVWPDEVVVLGRTVDVNITRLRKKLGKYGTCVITRHGYGYCFDDTYKE